MGGLQVLIAIRLRESCSTGPEIGGLAGSPGNEVSTWPFS
jgi:hypothetical protein